MNIGVAAHITAAAPGGPRYDEALSQEQRKSEENGIWLCQSCSKLVDNDPARYSVELLLAWKRQAEDSALRDLEVDGAHRDRPRPGSRGAPRRYLSEFVGREHEMQIVLQSLDAHRLVTLAGGGGVGKTRLAIEVAQRKQQTSSSPLRLASVAFDSVKEDTEREVLAAFGAALTLEPSRYPSEQDALVGELKPGACLLLLDTCETAPIALAMLAGDLLRACPHLTILATSQTALNLHTVEKVIVVEPMGVPVRVPETLAALRDTDGFRLFDARAGLKHGWTSERESLPDLFEVLRLTEGLPLAIELTAAWVGKRSLRQIIDGIRQTPLGDITVLPERVISAEQTMRHRSLARCLEWSFGLLEPWAQRGLARLGVFAGSFSSEAVDAVLDDRCALRLLDRLQDVALIRRVGGAEPPRFDMHRFTRAYALERLSAGPEASTAESLFLAYYEKLTRRNGGEMRHITPDRLELLRAEWPNIAEAIALAEKLGVESAARVMSDYMAEYLRSRGLWSTAERLHMLAYCRASDEHDSDAMARALERLGHLHCCERRWADAETDFEDSLRIRRASGNHRGEAIALLGLSEVYVKQDRWAEAEGACRQGLALFRACNDLRGEASALNSLGLIYDHQSEWEEAENIYEQALEMARASRDKLTEARILNNLGQLWHQTRDGTRAKQVYEESLLLKRELGDDLGCAYTLKNLALLHWQAGEVGKALECARDAARLYEGTEETDELQNIQCLIHRWGGTDQ